MSSTCHGLDYEACMHKRDRNHLDSPPARVRTQIRLAPATRPCEHVRSCSGGEPRTTEQRTSERFIHAHTTQAQDIAPRGRGGADESRRMRCDALGRIHVPDFTRFAIPVPSGPDEAGRNLDRAVSARRIMRSASDRNLAMAGPCSFRRIRLAYDSATLCGRPYNLRSACRSVMFQIPRGSEK
jgi:hypothetical protein